MADDQEPAAPATPDPPGSSSLPPEALTFEAAVAAGVAREQGRKLNAIGIRSREDRWKPVFTDGSQLNVDLQPSNEDHSVLEARLVDMLRLNWDPPKPRKPSVNYRNQYAANALAEDMAAISSLTGVTKEELAKLLRDWSFRRWWDGGRLGNTLYSEKVRCDKVALVGRVLDGLSLMGPKLQPLVAVLVQHDDPSFVCIDVPSSNAVIKPTSLGSDAALSALTRVLVPRTMWESAWEAVHGRRMAAYCEANARADVAAEKAAMLKEGKNLYAYSGLRFDLEPTDDPAVWRATSMAVEGTYTGQTGQTVMQRQGEHASAGRTGRDTAEGLASSPSAFKTSVLEQVQRYMEHHEALSAPGVQDQAGHAAQLADAYDHVNKHGVQKTSYADLMIASLGNSSDLGSNGVRLLLVSSQNDVAGSKTELLTARAGPEK